MLPTKTYHGYRLYVLNFGKTDKVGRVAHEQNHHMMPEAVAYAQYEAYTRRCGYEVSACLDIKEGV